MLDAKSNPIFDHALVIGVDVAAGTGSSNSCLAGYDRTTREKVFEYASPFIRPEAFAGLAVAVARWFKAVIRKTPFLIWEANGPGRQFGARVVELGYGNIYLRQNDASVKKTVSAIPGVAPTRENKLVYFGAYRSALEGERIYNYSRAALEETLEYVFTVDGGIAHSKTQNRKDPTGASAQHGDRVVADVLAYKGLVGRFKKPQRDTPKEPPVGSLAWRRQEREKAAKPSHRQLGAGW